MMLFTVDSAKQFLLAKLSAKAAHDGVSLDDIEKRIFLFSEAAGNPDYEANEIFEEKYDDRAYESKVTKLLHRAYSHDKRTEEAKQEWAAALKTLSREDFYGLVMVDQAGIPRKREGLRRFQLEEVPFLMIELGVIALGFLVVFRPNVLHLTLPDWARWLAYPLFVWLVWYVGRVWQKMQTAKTIKRSEGRED